MNRIRPLFSVISINARRNFYLNRTVLPKNYSTKTEKPDEDEIDTGPIKYSKSPASNWRAKSSRTGEVEPRLWYEPYVILTSITIFMVYFTILREESDIDKDLDRSLYSRISGLEEHQLKLSFEYNLAHGLDTDDIVKRLDEIQKEKKQKIEDNELSN